MKQIYLTLLFFGLLLPASSSAVVTTVVNDLDPSAAGAILEITNIRGKGVPPNLRVVLNPGESKRLTAKNVFSFIITRVYGDVKDKYVVSCPKDPRVKSQITVRLVDIQNNSMPAGCVLQRTGKWTRLEGTVWDRRVKKGDRGRARMSTPAVGESAAE